MKLKIPHEPAPPVRDMAIRRGLPAGDPIPSLDEIGQAMEAHVRSPAGERSPRETWQDRVGFNTVSLGDWLALCGQAGVPCVPARAIGTIDVDILLNADQDPEHPALAELATALRAAVRPLTMFRWDMCAPLSLKLAMDGADGHSGWDQATMWDFSYADPRVLDLLYAYPARTVTAWQRPWVAATERDGYPVEFRAYVHDGAVQGISNYYPQRALSASAAVFDDVRHVRGLTEALINHLQPPVKHPGYAEGWPAASVCFTADFLKTAAGDLLLLEGGPPYGLGAHPCCFPPAVADWTAGATHSCDDVPVALAAAQE